MNPLQQKDIDRLNQIMQKQGEILAQIGLNAVNQDEVELSLSKLKSEAFDLRSNAGDLKKEADQFLQMIIEKYDAKSINLNNMTFEPNEEVKPKRRRRTPAEIEADAKLEAEQVDAVDPEQEKDQD